MIGVSALQLIAFVVVICTAFSWLAYVQWTSRTIEKLEAAIVAKNKYIEMLHGDNERLQQVIDAKRATLD